MSDMDFSEQTVTWRRFTRLMIWAVGLIVATLILLTLFLLV